MPFGLFGQSTGYKPTYTTGQKIKNFGQKIIDSRCMIMKLVVSMLIVAVLLFLVKREVFHISRESPIMSDLALTFALVGVTLGLKAATAAGLAFFGPFKCPEREEQMAARGWLPPPPNDGVRAEYDAYKAKLGKTE